MIYKPSVCNYCMHLSQRKLYDRDFEILKFRPIACELVAKPLECFASLQLYWWCGFSIKVVSISTYICVCTFAQIAQSSIRLRRAVYQSLHVPKSLRIVERTPTDNFQMRPLVLSLIIISTVL